MSDRRRRLRQRGLGTVEVLVSLGLFAIAAAALLHGLARLTAVRLASSREMTAVQRAMSIVEQLRNGDRNIEPGDGDLTSEWSLTPTSVNGLSEFSVTVSVEGVDLVTLQGMAWRRP